MEDNFNEVFGLPQKVADFLDKKERTAHPITMRYFKDFIDNFAFINVKKMWGNFTWDEGVNAVTTVMKLTFKDDDIDELMDNITASNYPKIMELIMKINGIEFKKDKPEGESDPNVQEV